eukprot:gb/GECG01006651.1/.p1 GENE.gb/GECG01006651.1/~~gb/GECG01006651.1/.p1  ORF type:complete len:167 (+),score=16.10 gb/GECG01006651.1/:1-501(+)
MVPALSSQMYPDGHALQLLLPVLSWKVPKGHETPKLDPSGQKCPSGHILTLGVARSGPVALRRPLPAQYHPEGQGRTSAMVDKAESLQNNPGGHQMHDELSAAPLTGLNVPAGHGAGSVDPSRQKNPAGQTLWPPKEFIGGYFDEAPWKQNVPAEHSPAGVPPPVQ